MARSHRHYGFEVLFRTDRILKRLYQGICGEGRSIVQVVKKVSALGESGLKEESHLEK